jgi:hypothetical protein
VFFCRFRYELSRVLFQNTRADTAILKDVLRQTRALYRIILCQLRFCDMGRPSRQWNRLSRKERFASTVLLDELDEICRTNVGRIVSSSKRLSAISNEQYRFMDSLQWVDKTYTEKHKTEDPATLRAMYYPNLAQYHKGGVPGGPKRSPWEGAIAFMMRYGRRTAISLAIYALSFIPYVGHLVLPAVSFYTFNKYIDFPISLGIFAVGFLVPKYYFVLFLQAYFSSRSLMRELLDPYFTRVKFTKEQKKQWFHDREGLLFGFGIGFYFFTRIPFFGVLIYGIAEASTAYLVTKVTDPPPPPAESQSFAASQVKWTNKFEFLKLPLQHIDAHNIAQVQKKATGSEVPLVDKKSL